MTIMVFKITGTKPLLMNNPASMRRKVEGQVEVKSIPSAEEEARAGLYAEADGTLFIPSQGVKSCLVAASIGKKAGKRGLPGLMSSTVFCCEERTPLVHAKTGKPLNWDGVFDERRVVIQKKYGVVRARPMIRNWSCKIAFEVDSEYHGGEHQARGNLLATLTEGGRRVGILDFRPEKGGPFGRFTVEAE